MNPTLKHLEQIEETLAHPDAQERDIRAEWLCARLRDALEVIEALDKGGYRAALDSRRRLFGEEESRG